MTMNYRIQRVRNIYDPESKKPFRISRTKIDLFLKCSLCFYLDRRVGIAQPPGYPFSLNNAVDSLLKKEFDLYRRDKKPHPFMERENIAAIPFEHEKLDDWRDSLRRGITYLDKPTNLLITGGVDDVWITNSQELIIVDYKATSKLGKVSIDEDWQIGYRRQIEIYTWLFEKNGFKVHELSYFVYCNGVLNAETFDKRLNFEITLLPYKWNNSWVGGTVEKIFECLQAKIPPEPDPECSYCQYTELRTHHSFQSASV